MSDAKTIQHKSLQELQSTMNEAILKNSGKEYMIQDLIKNAMGSANKKMAPRLAFTSQPSVADNYAGIFKLKRGLIPDSVIKQVRVQNHLIAGILRARGSCLSMFGNPRKDRFDIGVECNVKQELVDLIEPEQMILIKQRINDFMKILVNCGNNEGLLEEDKMNLAEFLDISTRNGLAFGRFATEIIWSDENNEVFNRFRPVDAGTIMKAVKNGEAAASLRTSSIKLLEQMTGVKINIAQLKKDRYSWIQYIDGTPRQAFTPEEMVVYNLYPSSDVEHNGYPVTPLDTVITSVTSHTSIEIYNKLYFQNGRAARGMLVIQSDEIDNSTIEDIKQQYNASINNVTNSFRTPIFGVGTKDKVEWISTQPQKKDGEFQYLNDQTTRNILMAFGMSPDELPGFGHLSRATNQQSLSESSSEYKLTAARDIGLRPLILKMQDFFNSKIFPLIDIELSQLCNISLAGLDAETREQESQRLARDMPLSYNYDDVLTEVDKNPIGSHVGGQIPFNESYQNLAGAFIDQGRLIAEFTESPAALVDPLLRFKRDQFFSANIQTVAQFNPEAVRAFYATRSDAMDILRDYLQDWLDENE